MAITNSKSVIVDWSSLHEGPLVTQRPSLPHLHAPGAAPVLPNVLPLTKAVPLVGADVLGVLAVGEIDHVEFLTFDDKRHL